MRRPEPLADLDWSSERARAFGQTAFDLWVEYLQKLPDLPVAHPYTPGEIRAAASRAVPDLPAGDDELFAHLRELTLERGIQTGHGGFMAYITGAGTVPGGPAALLAAGVNQNLGGWPLGPAATELETLLLALFAHRLILPETASGAFVTGGDTGHPIGLAGGP